MINIVVNKDRINKELAYTIFYLLRKIDDDVEISYEEKQGCINIYYGIEAETGIVIPFSENHNELNFSDYKESKFCSFEKIDEPYSVFDQKIKFNFDIIFTSKYFITLQEEYEIQKRDDKERFLCQFSKRNKYINVPFFDINAEILYDAIKMKFPQVKLKEKRPEIMLSHDVDSLNSRDKYVFLHNCKSILMGKNDSLSKRIGIMLRDIIKNVHLQIPNYLEIENSYGVKSEFYFIAGYKHRLGKRYELSKYNDYIKKIHESRNHKIGIHTNYFSYLDEKEMKREIEEIENNTHAKVDSCRNHYLRFKMPETLECLEKAGVKFDSTVGYSDVNGFRAASTDSFIPFNLNTNNIVPIYEIPLAVMDGIVMEKNVSFEEKWQEIKVLLDNTIKHNGTASVLWHQRVILDSQYKDMYKKIIEYCLKQGCNFIFTDDLTKRYLEEREKINTLLEKIK
ncbi:polysaccharide deacetylase family protein [Clostridium sp. YIM B02551]|uniref:polysaccharide deacetylase family protein n=1 Tax=Clostridium sp. YIM B02551 TaxID=2910679 RepID=UPI001EEB5B8D|nr:polysaccharide deacetylase family protein [Clostridium sp. YIM B02551]